jgi:hypothetical protein
MRLVLSLVLCSAFLIVGACDNLDTGGSASNDEATDLATSTTIPDDAAEGVTTASTSEDGTTMSTTLASVMIGPTSTAVFQASPDLTLAPLGPHISLDPQMLVLWTRYEEDDPLLEFEPGWETVYSSSASGGAYRATITDANDSTSVVTYFAGTRIRIIAFKDSVYGEAGVFMGEGGAGGWQGLSSGSLDLYSPSLTSSQVVWTSPVLEYGTYSLAYNNTPHTNAPEHINIDAVEVMGTLISNPGP